MSEPEFPGTIFGKTGQGTVESRETPGNFRRIRTETVAFLRYDAPDQSRCGSVGSEISNPTA